MADDVKTYTIGGDTVYEQRRLVLGQVRQLLDLLRDVAIPGTADPAGIMMALGGRLPKALAIVLTPRGQYLRDKDLDGIADTLEYAIEPEQALEVIEDFFYLNPLPSIFDRIAAMGQVLGAMTRETRSRSSASPSPGATSPGSTESSGA